MSRRRLLNCYREQIQCYISRMYGISADKADEIAMKICTEHYKPLTAIVEETKIDGKPEIKAVDLAQWFDQQQDNLISPSGSVYMQHDKKLAKTIEMILEMKSDRKKEKKLQFKAKAAGDSAEELKHYYAQTLIKITMNSLPGNYGSAYSLYYSKGNYNAITSCGRTLIGYANSGIEAVLGGNFAWFSKDELIQHIIAHLNRKLDEARISRAMNKYKLRWVSGSELFDFYKKSMEQYKKYNDFFDIADVISKMSQEEIQFFYYFHNLRHIIMGNEAVFREWFTNVFDINQVDMNQNVVPDDLFKVDEALVTMCNVAFHKYVDPGDSEIQVYDLPKERPDLAKKFVCIANHVGNKLKEMDELFNVFIYTPINRTSVRTRPMMRRNSAVISDTDSVIFTVKDWVEWYTGNVYDTSEKAYHIACTMIYWIQKAVAHFLLIYSQAHGAKGEFETVMAMKNEFLYPVMILADVKKHYAGIVAVQEGVILPKPDIDIKGVQFKGSDICKEATTFAKDFIEKDILEQLYQKGRISGHGLIDKVRKFEQRIKDDIQACKVDWFKPLSIRPKNDYDNPMSSNWYYYLAWQEIFAQKYGDLMIPTKAPVVPINKPTKEYFSWLEQKSPAIAKKFKTFLANYQRVPPMFAINPTEGKVPEELVPLIKITDIVHHNVKPCHLILSQIGIACGFDNDKLLFSDIYPIKERNSADGQHGT